MKLRIKKIEGVKQINASKLSKSGIIKKLKKGYVLSKQKKETAEIKKVYLPEGLVLPPAYAPYPYPEYRGPAPQKEEQEAEPTEEKVEGIEIVKASKIAGKPLRLTEERESIRFINVKTPLIPREPNEGEYVFAYSHIEWDRKTNNLVYSVMEPEITEEEKEIINKVKVDLEERLDIDFTKLGEVRAKEVLREEIQKSLQFIAAVETERLMVLTYYIERDIIGLGKIESLMRDPNIEDISCDGVMIPIYIFHRDPRIASIRTNIYFYDDDELNEFVSRLAQKANKTISIAEPLLDASLPDGSRIQATLGTDIARKGSNFCVKDSFVQLADGSIEKMDSLFEKLKATQGSCFDEYGNEIVDYPLISTVGVNEANLRQENSKVIRILKLPPPERLVKVYFKELGKNRSLIEVTENHKFHILTPYSIKTTPSINLKPDMWIPVPAKIDVNIKKLPIEEYLEKLEKMFTELDLYIVLNKELRAHLNIGKIKTSHSILNDIKRGKTNSIKFSLLKNAGLSLNNIKSKHIDCIKRRERKGRGKKISLPLIPSEDLAHFVGWCLGDGSITKNGISIHTGINKNHKKIVSSLIKRLFNIDSVSYKIDTERLYINSGIISNFLNYCFDAPTGKKSRNIDSPKIIEKSPNAIISGFIKGLFESDGSFTKNIQFVTSSERMAKKIIFLMTRLGIYSTYNKSEDVYRIYVPSSYYKKFSRLVLNNKETQKLVLKQEKTKVSHMLPFFCIEPLISEAKESGIKTKDLYRICNITDARKNGKITFDKAKALSNYINGKNKQYIDYLTSGKFEFKQIVDVEIIEKNKSPVYDITCNPVNFYIGGKDTPLFMHDTIRKFTERPLTPTHMLRFGSLDAMQLAYMWLAIDNGQSVLISGGSATGKTSLLNALSLFIRPSLKVVSIEDSVTGDSNILVWNNGTFLKTTIGNLVDNQIKTNGFKDIFGRESCEGSGNIRVLSVDKKGKVTLSPVSKFIRHRTNKRIYQVTTRTGRKIKVTEDHSLFSMGEDLNVTPVSVKDLRAGNFIAVPRIITPINGFSSFNIIYYSEKLEGLYVRCKEIKRMRNKLYKIYGSQKAKWWVNHCVMPIKEFAKFSSQVDINSIKIRPKVGGKEIPSVINLDSQLLEFIGLWLAEGCYDKNSIIVSNSDSECNDLVKEIASRFGLETKMHSDRFSHMINSSVLKKIFQKVLEIDGNSYTKQIPSWVFNLDNNQTASLIRGYFSGDGHVSKFEIQLRSSSLEMLKDIQTLLLRFGIVSRIGKYYKKDHTYGIKISNSEMLRKFQQIGFLQERKNKKLSLACLRKATHSVTDIIPVPVSFLQKIKNNIGSLGTNAYFYGSNVGREALQRIALKYDGPVTKKLSMLADSDIFWDEIKEIIEAEYKGYVYDLSIPGNENFICENIIAHNTAELRLPLPHWIPHVARSPLSIEGQVGEVSLFDLLKASLRQRPDYIIVGEVRGREAFVLFQQMASIPPYESVFVLNNRNLKRIPISEVDPLKISGVPTFNQATGKIEIADLKEKVEHLPVKELYRIVTKTGREVITTANHSVFNGLGEPVIVSELKGSEDILIPAVMPCGFNDTDHINLLELPGIRVYCPYLIKKASRALGFERASKIAERTTISNYYGINNCALPAESFLKLMKEANIDYDLEEVFVRFDRRSTKMPAKLKITPELLRFIGYHIAEGSLNRARKNNLITLYNSNPEILRDMRNCIIKIAEKEPKKRETTGFGKAIELSFNNKVIYQLLKEFTGIKAENRRLPDFVFGLSKEKIGQLLSGLYAGDSHICSEYFAYYTTSRKLANDVTLLLLTLGIVATIRKRNRKGRRTTDYEIIFYKRNDMEKFLKYCKPVGKNTNLTRGGKRFLEKDVYADKIKIIEKIELKEPLPVYDLSVPGTQNFMGGFGGVLLHNTGHPSLATIHAASLPQLVDRLITPPISLPPSLLENINIIVFLSLTRLHGNYVRKADSILEVVGIKRDRPETKKVFQWKPITNTFEITDKSVVLKSVAKRLGLTEDTVQEELLRRKRVLEWMLERGLYDYIDVANVISIYYADPERVMDLISEG